MRTMVFYVRIGLFVIGVLVGLQFPMFVDQYGKSLHSHYIESSNSIGEFQEDANRFFAGDMGKLIEYYKENGDPVFYEGGESIESIYHRYVALDRAFKQFQIGSVNAYQQAFFTPIADVREEVWENYDFATKLSPSAMTIGLGVGAAFASFLEVGMKLLSLMMRLFLRRRLQAG